MLFAETSGAAPKRVYRFLILDPNPPTVTITTGPTAANGDVEVTITARDASSGVKLYRAHRLEVPGDVAPSWALASPRPPTARPR